MASPIVLARPADESPLAQTAESLLNGGGAVLSLAGEFARRNDYLRGRWSGAAEMATSREMHGISRLCEDVGAKLETVGSVLKTYASEIGTIRSTIATLQKKIDAAYDAKQKVVPGTHDSNTLTYLMQKAQDDHKLELEKATKAANTARDRLMEITTSFAATPDGARAKAQTYLPFQRDHPLIPGPKAKVPPFPGVAARGADNDGVRGAQEVLAARGWTIAVDGKYGPQTERVIRAFQREKGLPVTGKLDEATWNAIWKERITGW